MLILASASPRRTELLTAAGIDHRIVIRPASELKVGRPDEIVKENARRKAAAVLSAIAAKDSLEIAALSEKWPILGADTVVALDGEIFGKPENEAKAREMLKKLSGRTHTVYTGLCLLAAGEVHQAVEATEVTFLPLEEKDIACCLSGDEYKDKAGSYAIQGRAMAFIARIDGAPANVIGLPVHRVVKLAKEANIDLWPPQENNA